MMRQTPGKIFLSDQRGVVETGQLKSYCTFNFGKYFNEHKERFGNLYLMNEESLKGDEAVSQENGEDSFVIVIPMIGEVIVQAGHEPATLVDVEEVMVHFIPKGVVLNIINPYEYEAISFLQIRIKADFKSDIVKSHLFSYSFGQLRNKAAEIAGPEVELFTPLPFKISMGRFGGRIEEVYQPRSTNSLLFAQVLSGAFEFEGRLMHEKDSIALWQTDEVEFEALGNNSLVLMIEMFED
jgi:quercetin 2,3-dioxygenase